MIKCEVVKEFTLSRFDELKNINRKRIDTKGKLYVGDTFECNKEMVDYLMGNNKDKQVVVKVIEVEPEFTKDPIAKEIKIEEVKQIQETKLKMRSKIEDEENIIPLADKETLDKIGKDILKHVKPKKKNK